MPENSKNLLLVKLKDIEVEKNLKDQFQMAQENAKLEEEEEAGEVENQAENQVDNQV